MIEQLAELQPVTSAVDGSKLSSAAGSPSPRPWWCRITPVTASTS